MSGAQLGRYTSPLRYPGGKGKISNYVKLLMLENEFIGRDYVEPYAGGASVALSLLFEDYADHIHINDLNSGIFSFWHSVLYETDQLCELIDSTPVNLKSWSQQKRIYDNPSSTELQLGFSTFFLNRTNRSGIISGGVIGGQDQRGDWKIDARYNRVELIRRIRKIARYRSRISLTNLDANIFLDRWSGTRRESEAFIYLDPPYYVKGAGLYDNFYNSDDHVSVSRVVKKLAHPWIVSYDAASQILALYSEYPSVRYSLSYSAASASKGKEVMFFHPEIVIPGSGSMNPSGIDGEAFKIARSNLMYAH